VSDLTPKVEAAIENLRVAFPQNVVTHTPDGDGGAFVTVDDLFIGDNLTPDRSWVAFHLTYQYPDVDVYPHFIRADVRRKNGVAFEQGVSGPVTPWPSKSAISGLQVSRRSNHWNRLTDTAAWKLKKVLRCLREM
jgi:hypothetical protein